MANLFEIEEVNIDGIEGIRIVKNELFLYKDATRSTVLNSIQEIRKEILERGAIND